MTNFDDMPKVPLRYPGTCVAPFRVLRQEGNTCAIYAMAMLFNLEPADIVRITNYDGVSDLYSTGLPRSHHPQELILAAYKLGYAMIPIDAEIVSMDTQGNTLWKKNLLFQSLLESNLGLLLCERNSKRHFVAWDGKTVYDPLGYTTTINDERYKWITFFLVKKFSA